MRNRPYAVIGFTVGTVIILLAVVLLGTMYANNAADRSSHEEVATVVPGDDFFTRETTVTLSDGRHLHCVYITRGNYSGGPSCDWANAK